MPASHQSAGETYRHIAAEYRLCRPCYPVVLIDYLASHSPSFTQAWDCGTGNGQAASQLGRVFEKVFATDSAREQIDRAIHHPNVTYDKSDAAESGLPDRSVDLVTVAQAVHWFDLESFYREVKRILKPNGVLAVWCYHRPSVDPAIDQIVLQIWNSAPIPIPIRLVEEEYA